MEDEGSLAYSWDVCSGDSSDSDKVCVHQIQLHNRPDYAANISSASEWTITGSWDWLAEDLASLQGQRKDWPVMINLHHHNFAVAKRLEPVLEQWMNATANATEGRNPRVMVLFAHIHENHLVSKECIGGVQVPHIYVGSVPNNRYTPIRFNHGGDAEIFLLQANSNSTTTVLERIEHRWETC